VKLYRPYCNCPDQWIDANPDGLVLTSTLAPPARTPMLVVLGIQTATCMVPLLVCTVTFTVPCRKEPVGASVWPCSWTCTDSSNCPRNDAVGGDRTLTCSSHGNWGMLSRRSASKVATPNDDGILCLHLTRRHKPAYTCSKA
jgi:hypothetical protein